ncbi:Threonine/homoserine efflux transporter RhtA [Pseudorhodobacter antarcticus]|jgi:drug/metabolite transporter (DMT)-like permease|uniref:Threonine/homoserine efflux transporter RhtA n=1 Tax=Pseudorhodobacter antarcticus TaxID=1077947 RepID=A0A1H8GJZ7_9RHOB|nr:DMT family transporter [Pseudorhodobacter antarcticus]SEN44084.1 Threonine/homoserine efflux transporter RhtA [Pseudorhodobacter antarcticus]
MTPQTLKMSGLDWLLLATLSLLWGGSFFFVQLAVGHLPAFTIVFLRVSLAALALAGVLAVTRTPFPKGRAVWGALLVMGALNNALPFTFFVLAQGQIGSALASVLNATTPLFTLIVAHLCTADERLTGAKLLGLGIGFVGVVVMMGGAALTAGAATVLAQAACLAAAICYAFASVWGRRFKRLGLPPLATAFGMLTASSLMMLPLVVGVDRPWTQPLPGVVPIAAVVGLALLSTALAYQLYFRLLARAGAVNLALVTFLIPVSAIALAVLVLNETLALRHIAGMGLIALGLLVIDGRLARKKP